MANVSDGHIAVQVIERIGRVRHNDALRVFLGVDLVHGMNGCLYAEILATTELQTSRCFLDVVADDEL